jgi:hypothetical protein
VGRDDDYRTVEDWNVIWAERDLARREHQQMKAARRSFRHQRMGRWALLGLAIITTGYLGVHLLIALLT